MIRFHAALLTCAFALTACGGGVGGGVPSFQSQTGSGKTGTIPISHVILMIQENRSYNDFFAKFPGGDGTTRGKMGKKIIRLKEVNLAWPCDLGHSRSAFLKDYDGGKMDGFYLEGGGKTPCPPQAGRTAYQYVNPAQIAPYWSIASQYVLADHTFQTQGSGSFTAHQDLIRGGTTYDSALDDALVDFPSAFPWGCDASAGTTTSQIVWTGSGIKGPMKGPFPCSNKFPKSGQYYETLRDLLDAQNVTWRYYTPASCCGGALWNAFDMIAPVRYGPEWTANVITPPTQIFSDITNGKLKSMTWLIPDGDNSDHPSHALKDDGPAWVASVVNAVGESSYWNSTAIIIVWDDWGGFYDKAKPPQPFDHWGGLGFRVPMLIVSPYAREATPSKPGYISHTQYEFGSILKFVEDIWNLGRLGTTDSRANSIIDSFDFTQSPRTFQPIQSPLSRDYFEHEPPSNEPVDSE